MAKASTQQVNRTADEVEDEVEDEDTETEEATQGVRPADLATELDISAKALRGFLRREFPRPTEAKNTSWLLSEEMVDKARAHFTAEPEEDEAEEAEEDEG